MIRLVVLYGNPTDPDAFLSYYAETHAPIAAKIPDLTRFTWGRALPGPAGEEPAYFLTAELEWATPEAMQAAMSSPEGVAAGADTANFATGGVTMLVCEGH